MGLGLGSGLARVRARVRGAVAAVVGEQTARDECSPRGAAAEEVRDAGGDGVAAERPAEQRRTCMARGVRRGVRRRREATA